MTQVLTSRRLMTASLVVGAIAGVALGAPPREKRVMLDLSLCSSVIEPLSIDQRAIVYNDATGRTREVRTSMVAALLPVDPNAVVGSDQLGLLVLTDGQRYPGRRASGPAPEEAISWAHPTLGEIVAPLDIVSEARFTTFLQSGDPVRIEPSMKDELLMENGDRLRGFIESLGDPVVIETDAGVVRAEANLVAGARLANPRETLSGTAIWLRDGAVARVQSLESDGRGGAAVTLPDGQSARLTLDDIVGVVFDAARLRPLARIAPDAQSALGERALLDPMEVRESAWTPAALDAPDMHLPGPMEIRWTLPPGAERFGAVAELPRASWTWGDCELVVLIDGAEVLRERLNRERPSVEFSVPVRGEELTIRLEPGAYGPVLDRIDLKRALILLPPGAG